MGSGPQITLSAGAGRPVGVPARAGTPTLGGRCTRLQVTDFPAKSPSSGSGAGRVTPTPGGEPTTPGRGLESPAIMRSHDPSGDPRILTLTYTSSTTDLMSVTQLVEL